MLFFREVSDSDGKMVPEVSGSIPLSEFKQRTLLLFIGKPENSKQYRVLAVDDSDAAFPAGSYCFMNLTKDPLNLKCGANQGTAAAGQSVTLQADPGNGNGIVPMQVDAVKPDGGIEPAYSNMLPFGKTNRTLVFVYQAPDTGAFVVRRVTEDVSMLPKTKPVKHE
jgi:hypothetical protein